jgi:putative FmdB family regulatory protein
MDSDETVSKAKMLGEFAMPMYEYRREDGTTFEIRQKFTDDPLTVDPHTGQRVVRVVQPTGVIFKGSGFYINDSKNASTSAVTSAPKKDDAKTETPADAPKADAAPALAASSAAD